jgi:predicted phosphoadenosine phosphosulfate sulfurtransferase
MAGPAVKAPPPSGKGLRILHKEDVLEAGRRRMAWVMDEWDGRVMINVSGGKDSQVLLELALEAARKKHSRTTPCLPLAVYWLDQEAEWQSTVDLVVDWMSREEVDPWLLQCPFRIFNATSSRAHWLNAWDPALGQEDYCHPQHSIAITENTFGTDRFYELFAAVLHAKFGHQKCVGMSGVRAEEARVRFMGATQSAKYKWVTWGGGGGPDFPHQTVLYPLYDWTYLDVWKFIHESGQPYNRIYDWMWQRGGHPLTMRVSNLTHEHAVGELFILQEVEPETYERLIKRMEGTHMAATLGEQYFVNDLPFMFRDWREYRDFLLEKMVDPDYQAYMRHMFAAMDRRTPPGEWTTFIHKAHVRTILLNDVEGKSLSHSASHRGLKQAQKDYVKSLGGAVNLAPLGPAPPRPKLPYS